jgi:hypothetical protein
MESKLKHLEIIQSVISRMAGNSFNVKGWCVTVVAAILGLAAKDSNKRFIAVVYYPIVMFWLIDGYFLLQERLYRELYDRVRSMDEVKIDFSMSTQAFKGKKTNWFGAMFSPTLIIFYGIMILATGIALLALNNVL